MQAARTAGLAQGLVIVVIGLLPMMAIVTLMPIVPALVKNFQHVPGIQTLAPLVLSAPGLCVALFSPFAGALTDRIGRRRLLLIFTTLYGLGGVLPFFLDSFEALFAGRLLLGVGEAFILTVGNALLGDYFQKEERAKWLMWQSLVGPGAGVLLITSSGHLSMIQWNLPFLIYGLALVMAAFAFFTAYEPPRAQAPGVNEPGTATIMAFPSGLMVRIAATTFVLSAIYFVYTLQFSLALDQMGIKRGGDLGLYTGLVSLGVPVGALVYKLLSKRSVATQFSALFALLGLGLTGIGLDQGLGVALVAAFVQQLGAGMAIPVLVGWSLRELPERFRGRGMGWWCSAFFLGQFVSPLYVTLVRGWVGGNLLHVFLVSGVICLVIAVGQQWVGRGGPARTALAR
ncbi:MFS transporter [Ideonella livida]|uniref:MFS transporter n=1 Tax=Ideonella livida TaxID=2707176 RepID=A0A7C9PI80_9BURK|nr:MFS transporter [Ideonella livida]NDY91871.1 MFS transporter [Ideonella livida]